MNTELTAEAVEYGRQATRAFEAAGADELVARAARDVAGAAADVAPVLAQLGAWDLQPRADAGELEAAAALCRAAGRSALPYPVAERLARPADLDADGLVVVADVAPAAAVAGVAGRWVAVTVDGRRSVATPDLGDGGPGGGGPGDGGPGDGGPGDGGVGDGGVGDGGRGEGATIVRLSPATVALHLAPLDDGGAPDVPLGLVLPCWTLLGMLDRAIELTRGYVLERHQFGQPLASFQGVQFQLTEAEVERAGVDELARYALWSIQAGRPEALDDALALRLAAVEAAEVVFRVAHQLHGAIGFCDETLLSWLSRASQPLRRLPWGPSGTLDQLTRRIDGRGLAGLFG